MPERRFPPPWSIEELDSCFVVKDANGQALAYMYFEKEPRRRFRPELYARRGAANSCDFRKAAEAIGQARRVKDLSFSSGLNLRANPCVTSSRSNIAEANIALRPSMFLLDAFPFGFSQFRGSIVFWLRALERMRFAAHPRNAR